MDSPVTRQAPSEQRSRWHYAWVVAGLTFTTILVGAGVRYSPGVLIRPLEAEFLWDRASISLAVSIGIFVFGLTGPLSGALLDRYGPRSVMVLGLVLTAAGISPLMVVQDIWQLYLFWGVVTGLGTGALSGTLSATVAARWFVVHRGLIIGMFAGAVSAGQLVFTPVLLGLTAGWGWRSAVMLMTLAPIGLLLPVAIFMRDLPSDKGLRAVGDGGGAAAAAQGMAEGRQTGMREAMRTRDFWLLAGSLFICGYTTTGLITTHLIPYSLEHGFDEATTAGAMALMGAMNMVGPLVSGWLSDRFDNRRLLATYFGLRALSLAALPFILDAPQLFMFAVVYGLDWIATAPAVANLTIALWGRSSVGTIYGWMFFGHMVGGSIAAYAGGLLHGVLGGYNAVFFSAALLGFVAAAFSLSISVSARREASAGA